MPSPVFYGVFSGVSMQAIVRIDKLHLLEKGDGWEVSIDRLGY